VTCCAKDAHDKYSTTALSWYSLSMPDSQVSLRYQIVPRWRHGRPAAIVSGSLIIQAPHRDADHHYGGPACLPSHRVGQSRQLVPVRTTAEAVDVESMLPDA
jgi:hypothetical protein